MVGALYLLWRLGQCTWVLKVSVLETGHTRYCSTSGSDPLWQSSSLIWAMSWNFNNQLTRVRYQGVIAPHCTFVRLFTNKRHPKFHDYQSLAKIKNLTNKWECWITGERSDLGLCPWDWSTRYCTNLRERPSFLDLLSEFGLISDGWLGSISPLEIEPMHLSVEGLRPWDWSYPVLQISGSDPLRQSYRLICHGYCRKTPTTTT